LKTLIASSNTRLSHQSSTPGAESQDVA
jgi:hypothetical protein